MPTIYSDKIKDSNFVVRCNKCGSEQTQINANVRAKFQFGGVKGSGSKGTVSIECESCGQKDVFTFG